MVKNGILLMAIACAGAVSAAVQAPVYTLGVPSAPILRNAVQADDVTDWARSNALVSPISLAYTHTSGAMPADKSDDLAGESWYAKSAVGGFPIERNRPQYYLGDRLTEPDGVDWDRTYEVFQSLPDRGNFLFDTVNRRVYVVLGETSKFRWVVSGNDAQMQTNEISVVAVPMSSARPKNIFWTDKTYGGTPIDLTGKFVRLFGPPELLDCVVSEESTGVNFGGEEGTRKVITSGVYVDEQSSSKMLYAAGRLEGQFVLAYYDSGAYSRIVDVITVRVSCPTKNIRTARVGGMLTPDGGGYDGSGLIAAPNTIEESDDGRGPYLYQHKGEYSYSPKNQAVFALRPTNDQTRNQTLTTWYETDNQAVRWPYEMDEYLVSWPDDMPVIVRGDDSASPGLGVKIPAVYSAELQRYQDDGTDEALDNAHARAPSDGYFTPVGPGRSLLKLSGEDDVWFVPFRSVLRTDATWYRQDDVYDIPVGQEFRLRGGVLSGVAEGRELEVSPDIPAYVYASRSAPVWNREIYSDSGELADGITSSVYAVTADMDGGDTEVEVWWSSSCRLSDMPAALSVPCLPQRWNVRWPSDSQVPTIAIASQEGGDGLSFWEQGQTLVFAGEDTSVRLPSRPYFSRDGGTVLFWTRDYPTGQAVDRNDTATFSLLTLGDTNGVPVVTVDYDPERGFLVGLDGLALETGAVADPSEWHLFRLSWTPDSVSCSVFGSTLSGYCLGSAEKNGVSVDVVKLATCLSGNSLGARANALPTRAFRCLDQLVFVRRPLDDLGAILQSVMIADPSDQTDVTLVYTFDDSDELVSTGSAADLRLVREHKLGLAEYASGCLADVPGAPRFGTGLIASDTTPSVYRQPDPSSAGFNPNEEHAFVTAGKGGYVVWALRCDLNRKILGYDPVSRPGVLVSYVDGGKAAMQYFNVVVTNSLYVRFGGSCTVGEPLPGPHPFDLFDQPWLAETRSADPLAEPPFRDRKGQFWARAPGEFDILMYYAQRDTFDWPKGLAKPDAGESVPWLAYADAEDLSEELVVPKSWNWQVSWPSAAVPTMKIGYTLTKAAYDLPEVWNAKSMAVLYPVTDPGSVVELTDPTAPRRVPLGFKASTRLAEAGLKTGPGEKLLDRIGFYYFRGITATLSDRLYIDPTTDELVLIGKMEDGKAGVSLLYPNVIGTNEVASVKALLTTEGETKDLLVRALDKLASFEPIRPTRVEEGNAANGYREYVDSYDAVDHYALTAMGTGGFGETNWVVLIENNAPEPQCDAGDPIRMRLVKIVPEYYVGSVVTREDPNNLLSEILSVHYSQNFCGNADDFAFEWQRAAPSEMIWSTTTGSNALGLVSFDVGGQGDTLANMVNTYWRCRYRAVKGAAFTAMGDRWSDWSDKGLAEGWVQRCLNNVTPFTQRMTDLYENQAETAVTMMRQAGAPYQGDVALNQENLTSVGLIELYRTILNKAESLSVRMGIDNAEANKQLLLAVERLADLYNVLGDEAYADAVNPTIGFGSSFTEIEPGLAIDYGAASSSLFCFDNQVSSLLDEELALIRGRDCLADPDGHAAPCYNRLLWNFTKGITAGEVAYAVNYGVSGHRASTITAETAAEQYPQGHGDAYGHYLSALQGYYRLLRNPYFSWGDPAMGEMNVADNVVNVDYYDESTFASSAANVAKAAEKAVELTALKAWRDNLAEKTGAGYVDANVTNAFGYGEWAVRGAYGALCNWAVANSLLPEAKATDDDGVPYSDRGLTRIDRSTVPGIAALSAAVASIEATCDRMDSGLNPLGLDANAVPFDLTPIGDADDATHYEQIRARAGQAFENARLILDRAQTCANRLKLIQETEAGAIDNLDEMEDNGEAELIAIYGRPYEKDVGPSGTYASGYYGPDKYHYMWTDLSMYGLDKIEDSMSLQAVTLSVREYTDAKGKIVDYDDAKAVSTTKCAAVSYTLAPSGLVVPDADIKGTVRPASGELQLAYADFLQAYVAVRNALTAYGRASDRVKNERRIVNAKRLALKDLMKETEMLKAGDKKDTVHDYIVKMEREKKSLVAFQAAASAIEFAVSTGGSVEGIVGLSTSAVGDAGKVSAFVGFQIARNIAAGIAAGLEGDIANCEGEIDDIRLDVENASYVYSAATDTADMWKDVIAALDDEYAAVTQVTEAFAALNAAQEPISKLIQDARAIEEGIELTRQQYANNIAKLRYNDMFFRKLRNDALVKYDAAFALAQKYTLLAAKAYAYETGSPLEATEQGRSLLRAIVGARALGETDADGRPMLGGSGDSGLSAVLAQLDANWANQKTQLGVNNPQPYATWFSLRHGLFRILSGETGDAAWQKELAKYWKDDIRDDAEFVRYCQPFASQFGLAEKEPGLVIPFSTTIDFARNLFGLPLAFDDAAFDSTWYATKISKAGVWFEDFNERRAGAAGAFATTPAVYLVPVGTDLMRVPGTDANDAIAAFDVVDQTIPAPFPITAAEIADAAWFPTYSGETAGSDSETRLRRHPSFRAYFGERGAAPSDAALDAVRLVGRSVWNTRWLLVIPAGSLNSDRELAMRAFVYGLDSDGDGRVDVNPVSDIRIGFRTYSHGGR